MKSMRSCGSLSLPFMMKVMTIETHTLWLQSLLCYLSKCWSHVSSATSLCNISFLKLGISIPCFSWFWSQSILFQSCVSYWQLGCGCDLTRCIRDLLSAKSMFRIALETVLALFINHVLQKHVVKSIFRAVVDVTILTRSFNGLTGQENPVPMHQKLINWNSRKADDG